MHSRISFSGTKGKSKTYQLREAQNKTMGSSCNPEIPKYIKGRK